MCWILRSWVKNEVFHHKKVKIYIDKWQVSPSNVRSYITELYKVLKYICDSG